MFVAFEQAGRKRPHMMLAAALFIIAVAGNSPAGADNKVSARPGTITITLDQAQVMKLPEGVATLVIGNPLIADVSIQSGGMAVLTGKGYGVTNLLALDRAGGVLSQTAIRVQSPRDSVVVYRGMERESYSCAPRCEPRITLGDTPGFFSGVLGQLTARTGQAQGGGTPAPQK